MIKSVKIKNFRKHKDTFIEFTQGINVIKGENEQGKSTILEAMGYALFGSSFCENSDFVTWGENPKDTKVELQLDNYTFIRGKNGAEVTNDQGEVLCTGQTDVKNFALKVMGLDVDADDLVFVKQDSVRGILSRKGTESQELIQRLTGITILDDLVERIKDQHPTGNADFELAQVERIQGEIQEHNSVIAEVPETLLKDLKGATLELSIFEDDDGSLLEQLEAAKKAHNDALVEKAEHQKLTEQQTKVKSLLTYYADAIKEVEGKLADWLLLPSLLETLEQEAIYAEFLTLPAKEADLSEEEIEAEKQALTIEAHKLKDLLASHSLKKALAENSLVTSSTCGFCGQDVSQFPEVKKKNDEQYAIIAQACSDYEAALKSLNETSNQLQELLKYDLRKNLKVKAFVGKYGEKVKANTHVFPVQLEWVDCKPQALSEDAKVKVKELQRAGDPNTLLESHKKAYAEVLKQVVDVPPWDETKVETTLKAFNDAKESYIFTKESENWVRARKIELEKAISDIKQRNQQAEAAIEKLTKDLCVFQEQVKAKHLATGAIKAIREAKPKIVRSLWDTAMTLTSEFLTEIRGEPSEVTFDDGFKVNGAPASSYSGSGKDVLGLALRVALTKAFVPSLDFLIVDEPFAKCSEARQQVALGFLASSGFDQIILVTHEEQSEAIADNLITIQ